MIQAEFEKIVRNSWGSLRFHFHAKKSCATVFLFRIPCKNKTLVYLGVNENIADYEEEIVSEGGHYNQEPDVYTGEED